MFGMSIFDVSGKGMEAAMSAVFTSGAYASEAKQSASSAEILTRLNSAVFTHSRRGHFVAFLLAVLDVNAKTLTFSNAGQMKPLLKSSGRVCWLDGTGVCFPLGMKEGTTYAERMIQLKSGDTVFLLTDGFSEAMNGRQEQYGTERLELLVFHLDTMGLTSRQLLESVTQDLRTHMGEAPQHDDMTMVVMKVL
jgi:sigma-B regulation protein RsbU (phosphoserine phosphatase)